MIITAIVAVGRNRVIGHEGKLPWHLPADLKYFKQTTMGHHIIMGRKTWEALPAGPLPGRTNIIISRSKRDIPEGVEVFASLEAAMEWAYRRGETEAFLIGGAQLYQSGLAMVDRLMITEVDAEPSGDAYFPELHESDWEEVTRTEHAVDEKNSFAMQFIVLDRVKKKREGHKSWRGFDY